jgi:hypothetical protein
VRRVASRLVCPALSLGALTVAPIATAEPGVREAGDLLGPGRVSTSADYSRGQAGVDVKGLGIAVPTVLP